MREEWRVYNKRADFDAIGEKFHIDPVVARVIRNRDIIGDEEIDKYLNAADIEIYDPSLMKDMDKGVSLMRDKIAEGKSIRIVSDYDVDGIMSNYILYVGLKELGADISYEIPDRIQDGYGINERIIEDAHDDGVDTIITCDNGIAAFPAMELAKSFGMTVIVTDHHEVPCDIDEDGTKHYKLVPADAIIDPKQEDCEYPFKEICGAEVAYKFIRRLYALVGRSWDDDDRFIEMVGLATVCDVMPLQDENRIYVKRALGLVRHTKNVGLRALVEANGLASKKITTYHFGFVLGPCFNATGRLESAKIGLSLLLNEDSEDAMRIAEDIKSINTARKAMTEDGKDRAIDIVDSNYKDDKVIVIYVPELHESLAGIVAGRIKEKYYRPTIVFTDSSDGLLKGSGRSIEAYNMHDELSKCQELMVKFGGHKMAAGVTIRPEKLEAFRVKLNEIQSLTEDDLTLKVRIDVPMPFDYITEALIHDLEKLEPFGTGNPKPVFAQSNISILGVKFFGKEGQYGRLRLQDARGNRFEAMEFNIKYLIDSIKMWFGEQECDKMLEGQPNNIRVSMVYHPEINEYKGISSIQIMPERYRKYEQED